MYTHPTMLRGYNKAPATSFDTWNVLCILREMLTGYEPKKVRVELEEQLRACKAKDKTFIRQLMRQYKLRSGKIEENPDLLLAALDCAKVTQPEVRHLSTLHS